MKHCPGVLFQQWATCHPSPLRHPLVIPVLLNQWKRRGAGDSCFLSSTPQWNLQIPKSEVHQNEKQLKELNPFYASTVFFLNTRNKTSHVDWGKPAHWYWELKLYSLQAARKRQFFYVWGLLFLLDIQHIRKSLFSNYPAEANCLSHWLSGRCYAVQGLLKG